MSFSQASRTAALEPGTEKTDPAVPGPGHRAGEHGGAADLGEGEHPEELAEAVEPLLEQAGHRLVGPVAAGDAGAAVHDDDLRARGPAAASAARIARLVAHHR